MRIKIKLPLLIILVMVFSSSSYALEWVKTFDGSTTNGKTGTITLEDWGFVGPQGRLADSFEPHGGIFGNGTYDSMGKAYCIANPAECGVGQRQHVITSDGDGITPDIPRLILDDFLPDTGDFENANVDALTTFFQWGYTTVGGSTFSDMLIDFDGDYKIAKDDMVFEFYDAIDYTQVIPEGGVRLGTNPDTDPDANPPIIYINTLNFQPYAVSDAEGWCGSVSAEHPNAHEAMAGQVRFGIIMDVYQLKTDGTLQFFSSELTPNFEMRSFGNIVVDFPDNGQYMEAQAVVNNTDANVAPQSVGSATPVGDLSWHNRVSFMGADVLETGNWCGIQTAEWLGGARGVGVKRYDTIRYDITTQGACEAIEGANWDNNSFPGFAYILRADANRYIDYFDESVYGPDPMTLDTDSDSVLDFMDNCPVTPNMDQADNGGLDSVSPDGIGDACQCGDVNTDGIITDTDFALVRLHLLGLTVPFDPDFCDVNGDGTCTNTDSVVIRRAILGLPPGISQSCVAAGN